MAFPIDASAAASAFGSQPFGKAMDGLNKANGPQPLNYEDWKANTGQAGAKGYQDYSQGFAATPAPPPPVVPPPVAPPLDMSGFARKDGQQRWQEQSGGNQDQYRQEMTNWTNNASAPPPVPPSPAAPPLDMSGFRGTGGQQRWMAQSGGTRDQYYQAVDAWRRSRGVPDLPNRQGYLDVDKLIERMMATRLGQQVGGNFNVQP